MDGTTFNKWRLVGFMQVNGSAVNHINHVDCDVEMSWIVGRSDNINDITSMTTRTWRFRQRLGNQESQCSAQSSGRCFIDACTNSDSLVKSR